MEITVFLVVLVPFSGFGFGYLLRQIAPEEVSSGKKYFLVLEKVLLVAAFVPALYVNVLSLAVVWILLIIVGGILVFTLRRFRLAAIAVVFALLIISTKNSSLYLLEASLVFLYGLLSGTLRG